MMINNGKQWKIHKRDFLLHEMIKLGLMSFIKICFSYRKKEWWELFSNSAVLYFVKGQVSLSWWSPLIVKLWSHAFLKHSRLLKTINCTKLYDHKNEFWWTGFRSWLTTASNCACTHGNQLNSKEQMYRCLMDNFLSTQRLPKIPCWDILSVEDQKGKQ